MASCLMRELCILLGKNIRLKNGSFVYTSFEILAPLIYAGMVYGVLSGRETVRHTPATSIDFNDLSTYKQSCILGYAPANDITDDLMFRAARLANDKYHTDMEAIGFVSEYQMMRFVHSHPTNIHSVYAFDNMTSQTKHIPRTLHLILRPVINSASPLIIAKEHKYDLHIMQLIMESYIYQLTGQQQKINVTWSNKAKLILYQINPDVVKTLSVLIYLLLAYLICRNVYCIAHEREAGIMNLLSRTGVNMYMYWLSWFITVFVILWLASLVVGIMMFVESPQHPRAYERSDVFSVLLYYTLFAGACTCYCIMGSLICQKAHTASTIATCLFMGTGFPLEIVTKAELNDFFTCIFINKNVHNTIMLIDTLESMGKGFTLSSDSKILFAYLSVVLCGIVNVVMARILYNRLNAKISLWLILPECVYWKSNKSSEDIYPPTSTTTSENDLSKLKAGIIIDKLCAKNPAPLENITLTIYENNVTVISDLDGNSSMTFLSILTGETRPFLGSVKVTGLDIVKDIDEIKKMSSLCPREQSAIFDSFTVLHNLKFFYQIKEACQGHHESQKLQEVIEMFELNKVLHTLVSDLNSAERRFLQIAIVYLSDSKVLLFDYPTLDMDPYTRSKCWNIIRRNTENKIVIVCTESIEEAEMVGDMIAVASGGLLRSYGSIEHTYRLYGIGYNLMIDKDIDFNVDRVVMIVTELISNAKVLDDTDNRIVFLLPMHSANIFYHLLTFLDTHKRTLGISRFSINTVSLEEAILEKFTQVALLEMHDVISMETTFSTPMRFEMYMSPGQDSVGGESSVDRRSILPPITDVMKGKSDVHKIPVEENRLIRYTGFRLTLSQAHALMQKKIIEKVCSFHLEIIQLLILATLAVGLYSETSKLDTHEIDTDPRGLENSIARVVNVDGSPVSSSLIQQYKNVFMKTDMLVEEYARNQGQSDILKEFNTIGASFHWDNITKVYHSLATHSTCAKEDEDLLLPSSITAIMNAYLYYFTGNTQHFMYVSKLSERHSLEDFESEKRKIARTVRIRRHHCSFLQAVSLLMVPYFAVLERTDQAGVLGNEYANKLAGFASLGELQQDMADVVRALFEQNGFKHLQHLSGVSSWMYWTISILSDLTTYLFLALLYPIMGTLFINGETIAIFDHIEFVTVACGVVMMLCIYVIQYAFNVPSSAAFIICMLNYFVGDAATITSVLLGKTGKLFNQLHNELLFLALPPCIMPYYIYLSSKNRREYNLCKSNMDFCAAMEKSISEHCCKVTCVDDKCAYKHFVLAEPDNSLHVEIIVALVCHFVFWIIMLLLIEYRIIQEIKFIVGGYWKKIECTTCRKASNHRKSSARRRTFNIQSLFNRRKIGKTNSQAFWVDPGISEHIEKLLRTPNDDEVIRLDGVDCIDPDFIGPPRLNFVLSKGESYCFVDTDKSSASKILQLLSGTQAPSVGKICIKGRKFRVRGKPSYTPIGYCMDTNSVVGSLTGREVLTIHAKLRGITKADLSMVVKSSLKMFNLLDKADLQSGYYSPSDQRLLNLAVAMIGDPEIILLNDPFGNLDVVNKSLVWKALDKSTSRGSVVIMCSDKIREISDKVTVVAILLNGDPVCIGSPESIRNHYCNSYTLLAKLDVSNRNLPIEALITSLKERFPKCVIFYDHQDFLHMRVPYEDTTLPDVFALMESAKKHLKMQSYKLVHTNLAYVVTAMQQRAFEETATMNEGDEDDDDASH